MVEPKKPDPEGLSLREIRPRVETSYGRELGPVEVGELMETHKKQLHGDPSVTDEDVCAPSNSAEQRYST